MDKTIKQPVDYSLEEELQRLRGQLRQVDAAFENCHTGISIVDRHGRVLRSNPAMQNLLQLSVSDYVGKKMSDLVKEGLFNISVSERVISTGKPVNILQEIKTGTKCLTFGIPVFSDDGDLEMVVVSSHDVTELYSLREKLKQSQKLVNGYKAQLADISLIEMQKKDIIARNKRMKDILELARKLANVDTTVLILGESGVGKEVVARLLHKANQRRAKQAFITINCGAIPKDLLEAELFGYEPGAFTGAAKEGKSGMFELASGGSILLDEVGEMPLDLQVKLLRVLQDKEFTRIGGIKSIKIDVRIIAATNKDLLELVNKGLFRKDLYYRLNVVPLEIPPLRERKEDIFPLAIHYLRGFNKKYGQEKILSADLIDIMENYSWPGNVRELMNVVERMVVTTEGNILQAKDFPVANNYVAGKAGSPLVRNEYLNRDFKESNLNKIIEETEKALIADVLKTSRTTAVAARRLGISRSTLTRKMRNYGIKRREMIRDEALY